MDKQFFIGLLIGVFGGGVLSYLYASKVIADAKSVYEKGESLLARIEAKLGNIKL